MAEEATGEWELSMVAGYSAAALTRVAREADWPDDIAGNAARLLIQDLGEFAEAMVACGQAGYWSPAKALERMFVERVEVLMGVAVDSAVAKRYLDSVVAPPTEDRPNRPAKKARPEDAFSQFLAKSGLSDDDQAGFRKSWLDVKNIASEWFVHPTAMGPLISRDVREAPAEANDHWALLIQLLTHGCASAIMAANPLRVAIPVEVVRAIFGAGAALTERGKPGSEALLEIHGVIAEKASRRAPPNSE